MLDIQKYQLFNGECIEVMKTIKDKSIDLILCDLPYGMTNCKWDSIINLEEMWKQYNRIIKNNGAMVLFSAQPFTTKLIASNLKNYKCGSTGVACANAERRFIGIELDNNYFKQGKNRIERAYKDNL
ncbi:hypothetical protein KWR14_017275 [Clostridioides difficile]|nr:hypothetical protein [Clostridioides difficile]MBH7487348.1 hypothetical protein [Clostridioides difficile]MBY1673083.1 hypothetical protein [Clostridioides difficile]MBY1794960.1 hypothetical protein [Clostridioides difficile]MBY1996619.1 hypothetical protein [Clostridioides difficile]